jgi:hypothetical protein
MAVRSSTNHHSQPVLIMTPSAKTFMSVVLNLEAPAVMAQFEAYALNGLRGTVPVLLCSKRTILIPLAGVLSSHESQKAHMKTTISDTLRKQLRAFFSTSINDKYNILNHCHRGSSAR